MEIKITDLINYPFPEREIEGLWEFEEIVEEMNISFFSLDGEKFDPSLFKIKKVYNNNFHSDESSFRYLLFFKNEFICIYGHTGDRGYNVLEFISLEKKLELVNYFYSLMAYDTNENHFLQEKYNISDSYTTFFEHENEFYYHIVDPYNSYCFKKDIDLIYINDNDEFIPVKLVKLKVDNYHNYNPETYKEENKFMTVRDNEGKTFEVPFHSIVFKVEKS